MIRNQDILDEAVRHQVYLERYASSVSRSVRIKSGKLQDVSFKTLSEYDEVANLDSEDLAQLIAEAQKAQAAVMTEALAEMTTGLTSLAEYEKVLNWKNLRAFTKYDKIKALKAGEVYAAALAEPVPATGALLETFVKDWSVNEMTAVNNTISKGYTQGWTNQQIKQAIAGTKKAGYSDGVMARLGNNTDAVVRTSVQHVANTARNETWARNSDVVVGFQVVATLDGNTTPQCRSLDGRVFPLGTGPTFPLHIRCRTTTAPKMAKEFEFLEKDATRSAEFGPVDAKQTYYDWLKNQDAGFQDDAIGPVRGQLFREGGLTAKEFAKLNLGRNFEPLTLDEMRKLEPKAFKRAGL